MPGWLIDILRQFPVVVVAAIGISWYIRHSSKDRELSRITKLFEDWRQDQREQQERELKSRQEEIERLLEAIERLRKERDKLLRQLGVK